jgi:FkbM family methyltransferase
MNLAYDFGMNDGRDAEYYLSLGYRVIAVDAHPGMCSQAQRRLARDIASGRLVVLNLAIADRSGRLPFYIHAEHSEWSSLFPSTKDGDWHKIDVEAVTCDWLFRHFGCPHYAKVDIEGADRLVIQAVQNASPKPAYISVETGPTLEWIDSLCDAGYQAFKLVRQADVQPAGTSGPFGEDAPGEWLNYEAACERLAQIFTGPDLWYDIHARLNTTSR